MTSEREAPAEALAEQAAVEENQNVTASSAENDAALEFFEQAFVRFATSGRPVRVASLEAFKPKKVG